MLADHFIGQAPAIAQLQTAIDASVARGVILPHTLLIAPPGVGKTQLARTIAYEASAPISEITLPAPDHEIYTELVMHFGILFLDEIHQAQRKFLDSLLPFLTDSTFRVGSIEYSNNRLTIIAATTDPQKLPDAFRSRFRLEPRFVDYTIKELVAILTERAGRQLEMELPEDVARGLAGASLGNPRQGIRLLDTYRDMVALREDVTANDVLRHIGYTTKGLRHDHLQYLEALKKQGGRASQRTLASMVFMPQDALHWVERDLLRLGIISISATGRQLRSMDWGALGPDDSEVQSGPTASSDLNPYTLEPHT